MSGINHYSLRDRNCKRSPAALHGLRCRNKKKCQRSADTKVKRLCTMGLVPTEDLPVASSVAPSPQPSSAPAAPDSPVRLHNHSVEEYQRIYHEVVDPLLRYKSGRPRPYSLQLGRLIKQKLWERLNRPTFTETVNENGEVKINVSYGSGVFPPLYELDLRGEPAPPKF